MFPFSVRFMTGLALGAAAGYAFGRVYEAKSRGVPLDAAVKGFLANPLPTFSFPSLPGRRVPAAAQPPGTVEYLSPNAVREPLEYHTAR